MLFQDFNPFQRVANNQPAGRNISRGSLIAFSYPASQSLQPNVIHDPYPLVIITDIWPKYIRGVNLHYLTFPYIKNILQGNCDNTGYSYYNVRADRYVANAFRMYFRTGMFQVKKMDCEFLLNLLGSVRSWSTTEMDAIKKEIRNQIRNRLQVKANELSRQANPMQPAQGFAQPQLMAGRNPANYPSAAGGPMSTENLGGN